MGEKNDTKKILAIVLPIVAAVLTVMMIIIIVVVTSGSSGKKNIAESEQSYKDVESLDELEIDVEQYLKKYGEITSTVELDSSQTAQSCSEVSDEFKSRGFDVAKISAVYTPDGVINEEEFDPSSNKVYPIYQADYTDENGGYWQILSVNGSLVASPVSYLIENSPEKKIFVSESSSIFSYDNKNNVFYEFVPDSSNTKVIVVDRIDSETLSSVDLGE